MTPIDRARRLVEETWNDTTKWEANLNAAQEILEMAVAAEPSDAAALVCLGAVLADRGKPQEAVEVLEKAIQLGSVDRNAYQNLAIALMDCDIAGRERAPSVFKLAEQLQASPQTWEAYFDGQGY